jgi:hypothetical protein
VPVIEQPEEFPDEIMCIHRGVASRRFLVKFAYNLVPIDLFTLQGTGPHEIEGFLDQLFRTDDLLRHSSRFS